MTPEVVEFITGSLMETDKYIEVADGHFVTAKKTGEVQIKMCDSNGKLLYITYYLHQTCAIDYFSLLCY